MNLVDHTQKRNFHAHHILLYTALVALKDAESKGKDLQSHYLTVMMMCALSVESLCNSIGQLLIDDWDEWKPTLEKLELICGTLSLKYNKEEEPWRTAVMLQKFRNKVAHAEPEYIEYTSTMTEEAYERGHPFPKSKIEKELTRANAERAHNQIRDLKSRLCLAVPKQKGFGLYADGATGRARVYKKPEK